MRIRQVRPEFWQDEDVASWPEGLRLFYIGLWCVADDAGYFENVPKRIAAVLYPYEGPKRREGRVTEWLAALIRDGKVRAFGGCEHAVIPALPRHQYAGGKKSTPVADRHNREPRTDPGRSGTVRENLSVVGSRELIGGDVGGLKDKIGTFEEITGATR